MSYPLDSDVQEDVRTFSMYQRLRKINPYAYYSLQTQKQMQSDLRNFGSLTFFEQNIDDIPEVPEPTHWCCQTNENSHRIACAALIYALNSWRHSVRAAVRLTLKLSRE